MDSTVVSQLTDLAARLGTQAKTVFVWWFVLKSCAELLRYAALLVLGWRFISAAHDVLIRAGRGNRLLDTVCSGISMETERAPSRHRLEENDVLRAQSIIVRHWLTEKP